MEFDFKVQVQRFGRFLSGMVMPNIGAFIAWGLITAFFIPTGWTPNATIEQLVGPMIVYMLPILIAYSAGKMVHGTRGAVVAVIAVLGVIVGTSIPMFLGAMIVGPLASWLMKKVDQFLEPHIPTGFEMLINNFSLGILGGGLAILGLYVFGPVVENVSNAIGSGVQAFVDTGFLPLLSILVEPAKVLFLNNAINHGVFDVLGVQQVTEAGKSIFFMIETNPGPGLGVLAAYWVFGKGYVKASAPGAIIIHFFGGIHEIYFPYILARPVLILATIAGGASAVLFEQIFKLGLVGPPSPGSIFAYAAMAPKGGLFGVLMAVLIGAVVSFLVAAIFVKTEKVIEVEEA